MLMKPGYMTGQHPFHQYFPFIIDVATILSWPDFDKTKPPILIHKLYIAYERQADDLMTTIKAQLNRRFSVDSLYGCN
jgi:hypothetical protein